jgi:hypothetical protein
MKLIGSSSVDPSVKDFGWIAQADPVKVEFSTVFRNAHR